MTTERPPLADFQHFLEHKYAWPGGYPCYAVMYDGSPVCHECCAAHAPLIVEATMEYTPGERPADEWTCVGIDVNWETPDLYCEHCGKRIESAYAEEEA